MENYTFLESLGLTESEKQCFHFFKHPMAAILDFQNGRRFLLKYGNILASRDQRHMILVSKHIFSVDCKSLYGHGDSSSPLPPPPLQHTY